LETEITLSNVHDSIAFDTVFERLAAHYPEVQAVTADAGYKKPWIWNKSLTVEESHRSTTSGQ
jgi:hypothetical protein